MPQPASLDTGLGHVSEDFRGWTQLEVINCIINVHCVTEHLQIVYEYFQL